ncbi:hypothetical protein VP01_1789g2 [Puccinia sorghi]|uniref:Uncharacterized protein n=1 Tax=Puccinia sorghi TaxID=27349 RepID=A0A0L6VEH0_9BASI|nr:hypothetical protein VP01_1789g2 [Puccinia sorghi]
MTGLGLASDVKKLVGRSWYRNQALYIAAKGGGPFAKVVSLKRAGESSRTIAEGFTSKAIYYSSCSLHFCCETSFPNCTESLPDTLHEERVPSDGTSGPIQGLDNGIRDTSCIPMRTGSKERKRNGWNMRKTKSGQEKERKGREKCGRKRGTEPLSSICSACTWEPSKWNIMDYKSTSSDKIINSKTVNYFSLCAEAEGNPWQVPEGSPVDSKTYTNIYIYTYMFCTSFSNRIYVTTVVISIEAKVRRLEVQKGQFMLRNSKKRLLGSTWQKGLPATWKHLRGIAWTINGETLASNTWPNLADTTQHSQSRRTRPKKGQALQYSLGPLNISCPIKVRITSHGFFLHGLRNTSASPSHRRTANLLCSFCALWTRLMSQSWSKSLLLDHHPGLDPSQLKKKKRKKRRDDCHKLILETNHRNAKYWAVTPQLRHREITLLVRQCPRPAIECGQPKSVQSFTFLLLPRTQSFNNVIDAQKKLNARKEETEKKNITKDKLNFILFFS